MKENMLHFAKFRATVCLHFPCMSYRSFLCFIWMWLEVCCGCGCAAQTEMLLWEDRGGWAAVGETCPDKSHLFWRRESDAWTEAWPRGEGRRTDKRGEKRGRKLRLRLLALSLLPPLSLFLWALLPFYKQEATAATFKVHTWVNSSLCTE